METTFDESMASVSLDKRIVTYQEKKQELAKCLQERDGST
jgi:hypothetical protein